MKRFIENSFVYFSLLIVVVFFTDESLTAEASYRDTDAWVQINPQCGGSRQSPVNIDWISFGDIKAGPEDTMSSFYYDQKPLSAQLLNNGHSIKATFVWDENSTPFITGGVLEETEYVLDSLHFHWNRNSSQGSEHIYFGYEGALEMHIVHYNRDYGSFENALNFTDGLAVIGGIFETDEQRQRRNIDSEAVRSRVTQESPAINLIFNYLDSVRTPGSDVDIEPFAINEFQPIQPDKSTYISYPGSLTTPPCTENVLWLLDMYPYYISPTQLQSLQSTIELDHGDDHNNRPIQPMNERTFTILSSVAATLV